MLLCGLHNHNHSHYRLLWIACTLEVIAQVVYSLDWNFETSDWNTFWKIFFKFQTLIIRNITSCFFPVVSKTCEKCSWNQPGEGGEPRRPDTCFARGKFFLQFWMVRPTFRNVFVLWTPMLTAWIFSSPPDHIPQQRLNHNMNSYK